MREQFLMGSADRPVYRGDGRRWAIEVQAGSPAVPVDLTGARLVFTVAAGPVAAGSTPLLQVQVTEHEDATAGKTVVALTSEQTAALPVGTWGCELRAVWEHGTGPRVWAMGRLVVADALSGVEV
ncbi:hypothetical protein [Megalodesulfovibrio gigas]|uniref:Uncharacterized protein n=1 Tax=Megalodesulfovibrio gigas (strain ATCC 19364 / DSM 1382 / NCIMB 9332 / VKM B-1759) TaxID=1121448 RepID=T2G756_MEGG1|nr:hypothetical protein [Megalodesulfovibrio gigas]AGW12088.1 hypothetical protein DGI_0151 [Megalodesulfovibrio gigas DSM 1382 = ATCC 19364]